MILIDIFSLRKRKGRLIPHLSLFKVNKINVLPLPSLKLYERLTEEDEIVFRGLSFVLRKAGFLFSLLQIKKAALFALTIKPKDCDHIRIYSGMCYCTLPGLAYNVKSRKLVGMSEMMEYVFRNQDKLRL